MIRRLFLPVFALLLVWNGTMGQCATPRRIVSLSPAMTEMLFALGLGKRVVGDTVYCDYPPAARKVAKIGDVNTNYEKVLALRPDLIVADAVANRVAVARLIQLRQPVLAVRATSILGVEQSLQRIGRATGTSHQANLVVAQMERKRRAAALLAAHDPRHPKVLLVIQANPLWTAGANTFMGDLVARAGGVNIGAGVNGYGAFSKEVVLANMPDVVIGDSAVQSAFRADPVFRALPAVRQGRFFSPSDPNLLTRPGPRLADGLLQLARALYPRAK